MSKYSHLSHRGLMKLTAAQNDLIIEQLKIIRFGEATGQEDNSNNAWHNAYAEYEKQVRMIYNEDKGVKE